MKMISTVCRSALLAAVLLLTALLPASRAEKDAVLTAYFPNWSVYSDDACQVGNLPWDRLDCINHAFWKIVPSGEGYAIASTDPWADTDSSNPAGHFAQYAQYAKLYPETDILLSIGGWTCSGYFSEMALTVESRRSFIESCIATLEAYPFLTGIDLDWEYPGSARAGGQGDEGNPVRGDDRTNYTALLRELRKALDGHFGDQGRLLTVCAGAPTGILSLQDYEALHPYVDRINLMTYDFTGSYNNYTGHHSPLYGTLSADTAVRYLLSKGVPAEKINIGSPLYSHSWKLYRTNKNPVGAAAKGLYSDLDYGVLRALEKAAVSEGIPGWHMGYDEKAEAAYLWNDDAKDGSCLTFHTYESSRSLGAKLNYIRENALGGLIVWQVNGDSWQEGYPMITQMYRALHGEEQ